MTKRTLKYYHLPTHIKKLNNINGNFKYVFGQYFEKYVTLYEIFKYRK